MHVAFTGGLDSTSLNCKMAFPAAMSSKYELQLRFFTGLLMPILQLLKKKKKKNWQLVLT